MLGIILKFIIRVYWLIVPNRMKGVCLFSESCSRYVFNILDKEGAKKGINAFKYRFRNCRHPYLIRKNKLTKKYELHLSNGDIVRQNDINSILLEQEEYKHS
ncbi:membrane protein insertion efficiency factor YidD [Polaribacter sp.]|uniref:membrane protein insertion efficiency factor YidD n=1 Tax=Polaribacter sp. TaxID=1920175 RepID=UPI0025F03A8C|nr:membrane protein insertion efficiency factor YidD [Polaribacter sp.]